MTAGGRPVIGALNRTLLLTHQSVAVLRRDKKLLAFPIAAAFSAICVSLSFLQPLYDNGAVALYLGEGRIEAQTCLWLFLWYYFHYFVMLFFNSALIAAANTRMEGREPRIRDGLKAAVDRLFPISMWTLTAATLGVLIRILESRSQRLALWISAMLGLTWTFATYFVGPVLMFEELSIYPAMRRSVQISRRTWGEQLSSDAGLGLLSFVLAIPGVLLAVAGLFVFRPLLLPAVMYGLMLSVVLSATRSVLTVALYRFAVTGRVPEGFTRDVMRPRR